MNKFFIISFIIFCLLTINLYSFKLVPIDENSKENFVSEESNDAETEEEKFLRVDEDADEALSFDEFLHTDLVYEKIKKEEFDLYDKDGDGFVTKEEYDNKHKEDEEQINDHRKKYIKELFKEFDIDKNHKLNGQEIENILRKNFLLKPKSNFAHIISSYDKDNDGEWNKEEYLTFDNNLPLHEFASIIVEDKKTITA
uniref:EF-hand domain-containing protein n=1 Tax=Parastrongyloides trichosuri TaxID=131310 RepID=A0A0N4ZBD3_PARTI